jgi:hypothetical protein
MTVEFGFVTTTPYADGSATLVTWQQDELETEEKESAHHDRSLCTVRQMEVPIDHLALQISRDTRCLNPPERLEGVTACNIRV